MNLNAKTHYRYELRHAPCGRIDCDHEQLLLNNMTELKCKRVAVCWPLTFFPLIRVSDGVGHQLIIQSEYSDMQQR